MSAPQLSYVPAPHEREYYGRLLQAADAQLTGSIGGAQAVAFFARSKLPLETLKKIWTFADNPATNSLDARKFAIAVRLIQLEQNRVPIPGPDLSATPPLRPVFFEGIPPAGGSVPPGSPQQGPGSPQRPPSPQHVPPRGPGSITGSVASQQHQLVVQDPYSMTPSEQSRYEQLFPEYTNDDFMTGAQAVALFTKSGLDNTVLAQIWNLADNPVDNKLDKLEFCLAMHLIVCVSKKNLAVPVSMPMSLMQLKSQQQAATQQPRTVSIPTTPGQPQPGAMPAPGMQQNPGTRMQMMPQAAPTHQVMPTMSSSTSYDGGIPSPTRGGQPNFQPPPVVHQAASSLSGLPGPPPITSNTVSISDAFEGLHAMGDGDTGSIASYGATSPIPPPVTTMTEPDFAQAPKVPDFKQQWAPMAAAPPHVATTKELASSYDMGEAQVELDKLRGALQKLQAENISLKATMGTLSGEEKDIQKELSATIAEIATLSGKLTTVRAQLLASKSRLLEAAAELKAAKEKKSTITDLIAEATATKDAIDEATRGIETANEQVHAAAPAPAPEPTSEADFFGGWGNDAASTPPIPKTVQPPPVEQQRSAPPSPQPAQEQHKHIVPTYEPTNIYNGGGYNHNRNASTTSEFGEVMGGIASDLGGSFDNLPVSPSMKEIDDLNARSKEADDVAREAEESRRQLSAQLNELRRLADEAEAKSRAAAEKPVTKKGVFSRSARKQKHDAKEAARLAADAKDKKDALLQVQAQVKDAEALSAATKTESERLRQEAEDAQLKAATAASMQSPAPAPSVPDAVAPLPTFKTPANGLARMQPNEPPSYSMIVTEVNKNLLTNGMGYGAPPAAFDANVMSGGGEGLEIPTPSEDYYNNPFG